MCTIEMLSAEYGLSSPKPLYPPLHWLRGTRRRRILRFRDRVIPWQMRHFYYRHEKETQLGVQVGMGIALGHFMMAALRIIANLLGFSLALPVDALSAGAMFVPGFTSIARRISLARGKSLYRAGQSAEELMVLVDGYGRLCMEHGDGRCLTVGLVAPGDLFGEEALLDVPERESTFEAVLTCQIESISREAFTNLVNDHPPMLRAVMEHLAQRLLTQQRHMALLAFEPLERRLAWFLLALAAARATQTVDSSDTSEPTIPIYHKDLAAALGVWRETITATMNRWANEGLIEQHPGHIVLKDMHHLRKMADDVNH